MKPEEKYAVEQFNKWWDKEIETRTKQSKYLARKAWVAAWFKRMTVRSSNASLEALR